jgi:esterase/lipase
MQKVKKFILAKSIGIYINTLSYVFPDKALALAYAFFCEPRDGKLKPNNLPNILKEAKLETIVHGHHSFHTYTWEGNKTKILLMHGWQSNAARWEKLIHFLKKSGSTIIAIDAPAHGLSGGKEFDVPTYAAFMHIVSQKHQPKIIIGHSMGGVASTYYQYYYKQDHIEKMILLGSPSDFKIILNNYIQLLSLNNKVSHLLKNYIKKRFNIVIEDFSGKTFLENTSIKGIIAHDKEDIVISFEEAKKLASYWKKAVFIETKGLGHSLHCDKLYQDIYTFLFEG